MLKAIIADDELFARENLKDMLAAYCPDIAIVGLCADVPSALQRIKDDPSFDVLFLDINLGKETGFDLLDHLEGRKDFHVVFVTAYDQYALQAFNAEAIDYLLKPISREGLIKCIDKLQRFTNVTTLSRNLLQALQHTRKPETKKMLIPGKEGGDIITAAQILFIQAEGSYTRIHLNDERELYSSKNLKHYEGSLKETGLFVRIHKSYIVNKEHIVKVIKTTPAKLILSNKAVIPISEQMKDVVYNIFD